MKPKSVSAQSSKRKLSTTAVDNLVNQQAANATRRTRSSSNADSVYTQRATRSNRNNAFFELPNNYGSRKLQSEFNDQSPLKKSRRSSTTSSSNISSDMDCVLSPPPSKRIKQQNNFRLSTSSSTLSEKENLESFCGQLDKKEDVVDANIQMLSLNKNGCTYHDLETADKQSNTDEGVDQIKIESNSSFPVIENGETIRENGDTTPIRTTDMRFPGFNATDSQPPVEAALNFKKENSFFCFNKPHLLEKNCKFSGHRKRRYSENENFSSRRIRRLSERGEMASVMEFVFNHRKTGSNNTVSPTSSKLKQNCKRNLRHSTTCQSPEKKTTKSGKSNLTGKRCNVVIKIHNDLKRTLSPPCNTAEESMPPLSTRCSDCACYQQMNDDTDKNTHVKCDSCYNAALKTGSSRASADAIESNFYGTVPNGTGNDRIDNVQEGGINDDQDAKHSLKNGKRSLRSSGVKCQPDYYALSLDLMIHRRRRPKTDCNADYSDLQVMSDSEIDLNKKSSIDSCLGTKSNISAVDDRLRVQDDDPKDSDIKTASKSPIRSDKPTDLSQSKQTEVASSACRRGKGRAPPRKQDVDPLFSVHDTSEPVALFDEEPPVGTEVYYFESDHVALKHNSDYYSMLRSATILEAQRKQALKDLEVLQKKLKYALKDPISFVDKLQKKVDLDLPANQAVMSLPEIDWSKYTSPFGTFENVFSGEGSRLSRISSKPFTRRKKASAIAGEASTVQTTNKIRSETFKKSWTVEEQRKLEELLLKYPQEAVEFNRFRKIASELGNRTPLQVQSRVQKYFIKLAKAGLPIPGRMPRLDRMLSCKNRANQRHRSHQQAALTRISTFFSNFHIPVKMSDEDDMDVRSSITGDDDEGWDALKEEQISDEEDVPDELRFSDEYLEILQLKRHRKQQLCIFENNGRQAIACHHGYQCDICDIVPIEGVRYHCIDCPESESVDLCQSCIHKQTKFETALHKSNHRLEPVYASVTFDSASGAASHARPFADIDYTKVASTDGEYNYLDPNFQPPSS